MDLKSVTAETSQALYVLLPTVTVDPVIGWLKSLLDINIPCIIKALEVLICQLEISELKVVLAKVPKVWLTSVVCPNEVTLDTSQAL